MKKDTLVLIIGCVDILSIFIFSIWFIYLSQENYSIQCIVVITAIIVLLLKMFFWGKILEKQGNEERKTKKYTNPEVPIKIGDTTFKIKYESEGEE
jgi:hypothetical protein